MKSRYDHFNEELLTGEFDLSEGGDDIRCYAVTSGYTPNLATDEFLSVITAGYIRAVSPNVTGRSVTAGVFSFTNPTFPEVAEGDDIAKIVVAKYNADPALARLIHVDDEAAGLPKATNGSDITFVVTGGLFEV
jgi:hypothetical protein